MTICILSCNIQCGLFLVTLFLPSPICIATWWCSFCSCCNLMVSFPSLVLHSAPCLHAIIQWHSSILLFICFSCLVGISFFILFLMAFYGFPSLVCLLLGGIICPYVCCSYCSMVHSPPLVVLLLVVLFLMLLNVCFYLVFCVFFLNALFLILPLSTLFYANCCYIL
jgi:hypothetical protein